MLSGRDLSVRCLQGVEKPEFEFWQFWGMEGRPRKKQRVKFQRSCHGALPWEPDSLYPFSCVRWGIALQEENDDLNFDPHLPPSHVALLDDDSCAEFGYATCMLREWDRLLTKLMWNCVNSWWQWCGGWESVCVAILLSQSSPTPKPWPTKWWWGISLLTGSNEAAYRTNWCRNQYTVYLYIF